MPLEPDPAPPNWPVLPDEAVFHLHGWLNECLGLFESHYLGQINRYLHDRSQDNLTQPAFIQPDLFQNTDPNAPPF